MLTFVFFCFPFSAQATADTSELEGLNEFIRSAMHEWKVPGLAIAIVKDGEVIHCMGYGLRNVQENLPVTPETLFAIGSISKSFTVTLLGMLVDEGRLEWDKPVRTYLPEFQLFDPVATHEMTPRDLVTHRSGLPRHDKIWYGSTFTRREMFDRLRYLEPSKDFRAGYQYQNLMFMTAGYLAGRIEGQKWETLVRQKILDPLGMKKTNFSVADSIKSPDHSMPYYRLKASQKVIQVPFRGMDEIGPAGSINSNVEEMIPYLKFQMDKGKHGNVQLLSEHNAVQMQTPQMVMPGGIGYDEMGHRSYGMGFVITTYRGHKVVAHGGGIDGFISRLSFLPRKRIGVIVLSNLSGGNPVPIIVTRNVFDRLLGLDPVDWVKRIKEEERKGKASEEEATRKGYSLKKKDTSPSHDLAEYTGTYENPGYGDIKIEADGPKLKMVFRDLTYPLAHFHYDIFEATKKKDEMDPYGGLKISFYYNKKGDIDRLAAPFEPNVSDIVFKRQADESLRERSFLLDFTGEYQVGPLKLTVALKGDNTLTLAVPGQPLYELIPTRGTVFDIKGLNAFSIEFRRDVAGKISEAVIYQPKETHVAKKK